MSKRLARLAVAIGVAVGLLGSVSATPETACHSRCAHAPFYPAWVTADTNSGFGVCGEAGTEHGP